jgi:hypothetical protein
VELSEYRLQTLREDDEFVLYRGERSIQPGSRKQPLGRFPELLSRSVPPEFRRDATCSRRGLYGAARQGREGALSITIAGTFTGIRINCLRKQLDVRSAK